MSGALRPHPDRGQVVSLHNTSRCFPASHPNGNGWPSPRSRLLSRSRPRAFSFAVACLGFAPFFLGFVLLSSFPSRCFWVVVLPCSVLGVRFPVCIIGRKLCDGFLSPHRSARLAVGCNRWSGRELGPGHFWHPPMESTTATSFAGVRERLQRRHGRLGRAFAQHSRHRGGH